MSNGCKCECECPCPGKKGFDSAGALPLCEAPAGKPVKVAKIGGGRQLCARMAAMGIYPGTEMEILCAGCGCPCVVRVRGGTLSLGEGVSDKILVTSAG